MKEYREERSYFPESWKYPLFFKDAKGCKIYDSDGNEYIDLISGFGVVNIGWQHPRMLKVLKSQIEKKCYSVSWMQTDEEIELAKKLIEISPSNLNYVIKTVSGSESVDTALRIMWLFKHGKIITYKKSFHGSNIGGVFAGDIIGSDLPLPKVISDIIKVNYPYCFRCPYGLNYPDCNLRCLDEVLTAIETEEISGILIEPVIGSGGVIVPPKEYIKQLKKIAIENDILLCFDEVITGFGRTGEIFASDLFDIEPDMMCLAKGLSSGYIPIGALLISDKIKEFLENTLDLTSTFAWTPLACRASLENINILLENDLPLKAKKLGNIAKDYLKDSLLKDPSLSEIIGEIRGIGLMIAIELVKDKITRSPANEIGEKVFWKSPEYGILIGSAWDWNIIVLMPPLMIDEPTLIEGLERLKKTIREVFL